jgi:transcription elongation factor GreB
MSKAFTSGEIPDLAPMARRPPPRLSPGEIRYVTPEGHAELRDALARTVAERSHAAALPEPARTARLADLGRREALLEATLATLTVLTPESAPDGQVGFGAWVTVEDADGARTTWRLVGADEADAARGLISVNAPVARALLGRTVGETVEVVRPGGTVELTIVAVHRSAPTQG